MKPLLPSLREKKRYLAFEIISSKKVNKMPYEEIQKSMLGLHGSVGLADAGLIFLKNKWNTELQRGIVKVSHRSVDDLKGTLCFVDKINNTESIIKSVGVSGILKKAEEKYLR